MLLLLSDLFYWTSETIIQCINCGIQQFDYQINLYLIFHLNDVAKYKNNQNIVSIYDCFQFYKKVEILKDIIPCCKCKLACPSNYMSNIYLSPEIFIIILDREKDSLIKFELNEEINLYKFIQTDNFGCLYKLFGIVYELNEMKKHFVACCKSPINNNWYKYNDDKIDIINHLSLLDRAYTPR